MLHLVYVHLAMMIMYHDSSDVMHILFPFSHLVPSSAARVYYCEKVHQT